VTALLWGYSETVKQSNCKQKTEPISECKTEKISLVLLSHYKPYCSICHWCWMTDHTCASLYIKKWKPISSHIILWQIKVVFITCNPAQLGNAELGVSHNNYVCLYNADYVGGSFCQYWYPFIRLCTTI